jgi:hypothetical protein
MKETKALFGVLLLCFAGSVACGHIGGQRRDSARGDAQPSPLKVEIKPAQTVVKNNEDFSVVTSIRNTSSEEQELMVSYCVHCMNWIADNPSVHLNSTDACLKTTSSKFTIKPGEAHTMSLLARVVLATDKSQTESVTFRLGFTPSNYRTGQMMPTIRSNAITVSVTR